MDYEYILELHTESIQVHFPIGKECRRVGCDGTHTLLCKGCEYATDRGGQCELPVNQGGTTEIVYPSLSISDKDVFLFPAIKKKGRRNYGNL